MKKDLIIAKNAVTDLFKDSKLSFEELAEYMGVSGMSLRRWSQDPQDETLGRLYSSAFRDTVFRLLIDGKLSPQSQTVRTVLKTYEALPQDAALQSMGLRLMVHPGESNQEVLLSALAELGAQPERQAVVRESCKKVKSIKTFGAEWTSTLKFMQRIVASKSIPTAQKFSAFGGLFYFFSVFDLIPDVLPVIGLLDDFAILSIVAAYYKGNFTDKF